jgi:hypothetical protein
VRAPELGLAGKRGPFDAITVLGSPDDGRWLRRKLEPALAAQPAL